MNDTIRDDHTMLISLYDALVSVGCPEDLALAAACEVQARPGAPTRTVREHRRLRLQSDRGRTKEAPWG